ncbi:MAG: P-II family nitrogen regulator [Nitrospina sp.]|jgi:nitrogen regulatory protein PII|nr:P-II family nitrogen regulator [Nitrospina sp.]MBT3416193.1 P-II family nitrogen regulator [Nitrospina sp.]MBT3857091.1 P-II family nitrogen regulator [Nitrospina sp.]MBT4104374.1 P-II family nitrogen regulator [Nitrospina sp.]MBT4389959.1 P-II family nitrogen regulator [Nitrospina sp.]
MSLREITVLTDIALITCIVQRGVADTIIQAAREAGAQGATVHFARGMGVRERLGILGVAVEVEKEVIDIVVSKEQVERVFERMYLAGNLDTPGMGIMYITSLEKAATYIPPDVLGKFSSDKDEKAPKESC